MSKLFAQRIILLAAIFLLVFLATVSYAGVVSVRFYSQGALVSVNRAVSDDIPLAESAVKALVTGPFMEEIAVGITSRIPAGVKIRKLSLTKDTAEIDLSSEILAGLDEAGLYDIFEQFRTTLGDFPSITTIKLTCNGKVLASYLPEPPVVGEPARPLVKGNAVGLSGKKICVGPSHGRLYTSGYGWQRGDFCNFGEAVLEDTNSVRLVQFLKQYIVQDGGTFFSPRELDETNCCHPDTGMPWWKMCAMSWLKKIGAPCSVWASSSGNCGAETAVNRNSDDIRCRPLYADYMGADIYIAHHTNAAGSSPSNANGTVTYRDTQMAHPAHVANSLNLATAIQNNIIATIRNTFPGESNWYDRHVLDSAGGFGEIRIPNRPACLIELAFHDNCQRDGLYLTNDFFRSLSEWAVYKGICEYFGNTPTWDKYSCELVSDTIPTSMMPGQTYNVSVTMRNRGVCWMSTYGFRLGAFGDSDPFAPTRHDVSGTIRPGQTFTFNFTMKAPMIPGNYVSDWQMLREGYQWFGPKLVKNITVVSIDDDEPPTAPTNLRINRVTSTGVTLEWDASTDNLGIAGYRIWRNGLVAAISAGTGTTFTDNGVANNTAYTYQVDAYDGKPNYSGKSNSVQCKTPAAVFKDGFTSLSQWLLDPDAGNNVMPTLSAEQNHASFPGANSVYFPGNVVNWIYHNFSTNLESGGYRTGILSGWIYDNDVSNLRVALRAYVYDSSGNTKSIYWIGVSNGTPPGIPKRYIGGVYDGGWTYYDLGARSEGWHQLAIEILPYTGSNDLKFYVDGALKATVSQPSKASNAVIRRAYLGFNYTPNQPTYWDDIALESGTPDAPSNVTGVGLSPTSIRWNFTDNADNEIGHRVYNGSTKVAEREVFDINYVDETGLAPNTAYTRTVKAYAGMLTSAGANGTGTTLSVPPSTSTVTCDKDVNVSYGDDKFTFTAVGGFGVGTVDHYKIAWTKQPTHTWTGSETSWSSGTSVQIATTAGSWYLHLKGYNSAGVENGTAALGPYLYNSDSVAPTINSVFVAPAMAAGGDAVHVTVDATDNVGVTSVKADGVSLTNTGGNVWSGDIVALSGLGLHTINVVASDAAGNNATDTSGTYLTALIRGASNKAAWGVEMNAASSIYLFKFWGKVTEVDNNTFTLDDGSGSPITVNAPGYKSVISTGDFAAARGILTINGLGRTVQSEIDWITKY